MFQYELNFKNELIVDNFAGCGGASIGIELGSNRYVDIAINHDPAALAVHELNHPHTRHLKSDVFEVDPVVVCNGKPVGLAWFSPDCRHFSKAKGGKPVEKKIRGLAWVARRWAKAVRPRVFILENVEEFLTWGPLIPVIDKQGNIKRDKNGVIEMKPDPDRSGLTFKTFNQWFIRNGYKTEYKILRACDYGAPTIRKRLFFIARCDNEPIIWPSPTHGPKTSKLVKKRKQKPFRTAAECINWEIPCPSIFMSKAEAKDFTAQTGIRLKRPLADATLKRIAKGIVKFVLEDPNPFIVTYYGNKKDGDFRGQKTSEPLKTQTTENRHAICTPCIIPIANYSNGRDTAHPANEPIRTITAWPKGGTFAVCTPFVAPIQNYSQGIVAHPGNEPVKTITSRNNFAICAPIITRPFGQSIGHKLDDPTGSITAGGMGKTQFVNVIASPMIARQFNTGVCHSSNQPLATIMAGGGGGKNQLVSAFLAKHYTGVTGSDIKQPVGTVTAIDHHSLVSVHLSKKDIEAGAARVAAFILKYYGKNIGHDIRNPVHTVTSNDHFGLVTVTIQGEPWVIVDIGIRMLQPEELKRAQGFPENYNLGNHSKTTKVRLIGNSVPPDVANALVRANFNNLNMMQESA